MERYKAWTFDGISLRRVDSRRRIRLPPNYTKAIHDKTSGLVAILRKLPEKGKSCIQCLDEIAFDSVRQMLTINGFLSDERTAQITPRAFYSGACEVNIYQEGVLVFPKDMRMIEFAGINEFAILIGRGNYFLISAPENFAQAAKLQDSKNPTKIIYPLLAQERILGYRLVV